MRVHAVVRTLLGEGGKRKGKEDGGPSVDSDRTVNDTHCAKKGAAVAMVFPAFLA